MFVHIAILAQAFAWRRPPFTFGGARAMAPCAMEPLRRRSGAASPSTRPARSCLRRGPCRRRALVQRGPLRGSCRRRTLAQRGPSGGRALLTAGRAPRARRRRQVPPLPAPVSSQEIPPGNREEPCWPRGHVSAPPLRAGVFTGDTTRAATRSPRGPETRPTEPSRPRGSVLTPLWRAGVFAGDTTRAAARGPRGPEIRLTGSVARATSGDHAPVHRCLRAGPTHAGHALQPPPAVPTPGATTPAAPLARPRRLGEGS